MKSRIMITLSLLLFFALPGQLLAQAGNIQFGNLRIIPSLTGQVVYDTNIYLKNGSDQLANKKESDWVYHAGPGLSFNYTIPQRGRVNLGYQGNWAFYDKNTKNNWKSQRVLFDADYAAPGGLILGASNLWMTSEDPYGSADQYALGRVTKRWTDDLKVKAGYNFSNVFKTIAYYNFYKQEYRDKIDFAQNYDNSEYGLGLEAKIMARTWGFLRYYYGQRKYNTFYSGLTPAYNSDFNYHRLNAGVAWDASDKINGELNFGYLWKTYQNEFTDVTKLSRRENSNTWVAATSITFSPFSTTSITLSIDRALRDSNANTNEYFEDTGCGLTLRQTIFTKFVLNAGGQYSRNIYNLPVGNARKDDNYSANIGLDYNIQTWLTLGASYKYMKKDSNIAISSFTGEQGMLTLRISY